MSTDDVRGAWNCLEDLNKKDESQPCRNVAACWGGDDFLAECTAAWHVLKIVVHFLACLINTKLLRTSTINSILWTHTDVGRANFARMLLERGEMHIHLYTKKRGELPTTRKFATPLRRVVEF